MSSLFEVYYSLAGKVVKIQTMEADSLKECKKKAKRESNGRKVFRIEERGGNKADFSVTSAKAKPADEETVAEATSIVKEASAALRVAELAAEEAENAARTAVEAVEEASTKENVAAATEASRASATASGEVDEARKVFEAAENKLAALKKK